MPCLANIAAAYAIIKALFMQSRSTSCLNSTTVPILLKINFFIPEDGFFVSNKFDIDPCTHGGDTLDQKTADGRTDSFSAFYTPNHAGVHELRH